MKVCVVGAGYVGLSLATLISKHHSVKLLEINQDKIDKINNRVSPIKDGEIESFFSNENLDLDATSIKEDAYANANFIIIATPTNYDDLTGSFDTTSVENIINDAVKINNNTKIVIKSTVPVGFTEKVKNKFNNDKIFFSPEFLREGRALLDNLNPSRIVVGDTSDLGKEFAKLLIECSLVPPSNELVFYMSSTEAESVKLFANAYLALRVSFFNELDSFSEINELSTKKIINGVSSDPRIGNFYNNPSFGYGGYCLPKDTKQLLSNFSNLPASIIKSTIESNSQRKEFIFNQILNKKPKTIGIYKLSMKSDSDNFRESAVSDIIEKLLLKNLRICLYEPLISYAPDKIELINDFSKFTTESDIILANRFSSELEFVRDKVYSRDIFGEN